jgi:hypothetical protein
MAVILKIIWRAAPAPCGRRLGVSAKRSMSGHPQNVRLSGGDDAKPDGMIVGREGGPAPGNVGGDWPGPRQLPFKNRRHLMFEMTLKSDLLNQAVRSAKLPC